LDVDRFRYNQNGARTAEAVEFTTADLPWSHSGPSDARDKRDKAIDHIANIGPRGQERRQRVGIMALVAAALLAAVLFGIGAPPGWRLVLFPPLWIAGLGFFQARDKTWVKLAARGLRDMDKGAEPVADPAERRRIRRQARIVHMKSLITAAILTTILVLA